MSNRYVQPLRGLIQIAFLLFTLLIGYQFARFVSALLSGSELPLRPGGIEAFLPISGLFGTVAWLKGGGINPLHPAAVVIFITIIGVAWVLRRAFCSWICPVGTLSEWLWKFGFSKFHRNLLPPRWLDIGLRGIKYLLLAFFLVTALSWSLTALEGFLYSGYHATPISSCCSSSARHPSPPWRCWPGWWPSRSPCATRSAAISVPMVPCWGWWRWSHRLRCSGIRNVVSPAGSARRSVPRASM